MSKTFENTHTVHGKMTVREDGGCVSVSVNMDSPSDTIIHISPSDAPALALAILEAAGWPECEPTSVTHTILSDLNRVVELQERVTAEAKEQAELEAEALVLFSASRLSYETVPSFDGYPNLKLSWLAVARKAREMAKEATNGR